MRTHRAIYVHPCLLKFGRSALAFLLTFSVFIASGLAQNTIHVPADQPTIQAAINAAAQSGDTILVSPGTYNENIDFKGKSIVVTSGAKTFSDSAVASTIINGSTDGPVVNFVTNEPATSILNGFTVQNGHSSSGGIAGGVFISNASPQITNNIITNNLGCGIHVVNLASPLIQGNDIKQNTFLPTGVDNLCSSSSGDAGSGTGLAIAQAGNLQVIGNTIEDNHLNETAGSPPCGAGVYIYSAAQILLINNTIRNNHAACNPGIYEPQLTQVINLVLIQNLIYGNISDLGQFPIQVLLEGTTAAPYPSITEINNTIYGSGQELVFSFGPSTISNNIFVNTSPPQLFSPEFAAGLFCTGSEAQSSPITISHNDIFNTGQLQSGGCTLGPGNLSVDPLFLNLSSDFHTQPTSPVVAAGDIHAPLIPTADLDEKARTVCGTIDMGVYEIRPHPPITLTGSPQTAPGQSDVTFTATVAGNCNMPTGVLTFLDGTTVLGTATLNGSGIATFNTSFLFVGTHPISATYPGDFNFEDSTSNVVTEIITGPPTTTVLNTVSPNPARPLQAITMTATVSSAFTTPTGNITFMANGAALATVPVAANGTAVATVSTLHAGTYSITAVYNGSTMYAASTSNVITETVLGTDTTATLAASPNPAIPGQSVTLTATVFGSQTGIPLTGTVTFKDGAATLGAVSVGANGGASFSTSALLTGTHPITATYGGSADYNISVSNTVVEVITAIPTSIGLSVSPNPATAGQSVTMIATAVSNPGNQTPTGAVTFADQFGILGTAPLVAGVASFTTTTLTAGTHQVTAILNPSGSFAPSTSAVVSEVVNAFDFAVTASSSSLTIPSNAFEVLTVTVTPSGGFPNAVNLSCSQVPLYAECVFSPSTTNPLSKGAQTVKLTVSTSSVFRYGKQVGSLTGSPRSAERSSVAFAILFVPAMWFLGLRGRSSTRLISPLRRLLLMAIVAVFTLGLGACSGQLPLGTSVGSYSLSITAADTAPTSLSHSVDVKLQVTP